MFKSKRHGMERRTFLLAAGSGAASILRGADDQIRAALVGAGWRGRFLAGEFRAVGADVPAVCDVYEGNLNAGLKAASPGARGYDDYRRVLDDKSIDAVVIATPDHWHAKMTIDAVAAGKDVYVEKPMAHHMEEGFQVVEAVRRTKRIVQVGTQRRSFGLFQDAKALADSGVLGEVRLVTSQWMDYAQDFTARKLEGNLDWSQWLGPAPKRELDLLRFSAWYYFWDYSGGLLVGQAAHIVDSIQWFMNQTHPVAVTCAGARPNLKGVEVPETATILIEYADNLFVNFTLGYRAMKYNSYNDQLKQFHGTKARFDVGREWFALYPRSNSLKLEPSVERKQPGEFWPATKAHIRNFLDCMRTRRDPNATVEHGQSTNIVLAMAMESLRSGRRIRFNPKTRKAEA